MAITNFKDDIQQKELHAELNELFGQLADSLKINYSIEGIHSESPTLASFTVCLSVGKLTQTSKYEVDWVNKAYAHGLPIDCLHKVLPVILRGGSGRSKIYEIIGITSTRKRKYPVIIKEVDTGKMWKVTPETIKAALKKANMLP